MANVTTAPTPSGWTAILARTTRADPWTQVDAVREEAMAPPKLAALTKAEARQAAIDHVSALHTWGDFGADIETVPA